MWGPPCHPVLGVVVQNESPGGWAISASGDPWLCVPASRRVCPEQSFEATNPDRA